MATSKIEATLRIELMIRNDAPSHRPYQKLSRDEKCAVKEQFLAHLRKPKLAALLARWSCLLADIDSDCCEMDDKELRTLINGEFKAAAKELDKELGFTFLAGESTQYSLCAKIPSCGHICDHLFSLVRSDTHKPWVLTSNGFEAQVIASLEWTSPNMSHVAHDHGVAPGGGRGAAGHAHAGESGAAAHEHAASAGSATRRASRRSR